MAKLDGEQRSNPWWTFVGDSSMTIGGFMAGPIACGRVSESACEPVNLGGLALSALVFTSLGITAFALGGL